MDYGNSMKNYDKNEGFGLVVWIAVCTLFWTLVYLLIKKG